VVEPLTGWHFTQEYSQLNSENFQQFLHALSQQLGNTVAILLSFISIWYKVLRSVRTGAVAVPVTLHPPLIQKFLSSFTLQKLILKSKNHFWG
jgi:hypothetical protein